MFSLCSRLPCASRQTILQPVRKPGSMANTRFCPNGGASSSWRRFSTNTRMASSSAFSFVMAANSVSMDGLSKRLYASCTASATWRPHSLLLRTNWRSSLSIHSSSSGLMDTFNIPSDSARRMASRRWEVQRFRGSENSK